MTKRHSRFKLLTAQNVAIGGLGLAALYFATRQQQAGSGAGSGGGSNILDGLASLLNGIATLNPLGALQSAEEIIGGGNAGQTTHPANVPTLPSSPTVSPLQGSVSPVQDYANNLNASQFYGVPISVGGNLGVQINPLLLALPGAVTSHGVLQGTAAAAQNAITQAALASPKLSNGAVLFGSITPQYGGGVGTYKSGVGASYSAGTRTQTSPGAPVVSTLTTTQKQALGLM